MAAGVNSLPPTLPGVDVAIEDWPGETDLFSGCTIISNGVEGSMTCKLLVFEGEGLEPTEIDTLRRARIVSDDADSLQLVGESDMFRHAMKLSNPIATWLVSATRRSGDSAEEPAGAEAS